MLYCFLDTNIFHEFKPITEINWVKELGTSKVCLIVTSVVVQELDKHKGGNNNRLKKRAGKWTAFLEKLDVGVDNELRHNVTLRFDLSEPRQGTFGQKQPVRRRPRRPVASQVQLSSCRRTTQIKSLLSQQIRVGTSQRLVDTSFASGAFRRARLNDEPDPVIRELNQLRY